LSGQAWCKNGEALDLAFTCGDDSRLIKWNITTGTAISTTLVQPTTNLWGLAIRGSLVFAPVKINNIAVLRAYDMATMLPVRDYQSLTTGGFQNLMTLGDYVYASVYAGDGKVYQFSIENGTLFRTYYQEASLHLGFYLAGDVMIVGSDAGKIYVYNTTDGTSIRMIATGSSVESLYIYGDFFMSGHLVRRQSVEALTI
jgi:outer membrane protein assembly factor BamB